MTAAARLGVAYWAIVFTIGFAFGVIRTTIVAPRLGVTTAVLLELPLILMVSALVAARLLRGRALPTPAAIVMGVVALALTLASEAVLAIVLMQQPVGVWAASLTVVPGVIGLAGQVVFAALPVLFGRWSAPA